MEIKLRPAMAWVTCCIILALAVPASSSAQTIRLTFAMQNPEVSWGAANALKPWVKRVEEATKGRVKVDVYYAQTLTKGTDAWNAVRLGVADMAWCFHGYWPGMTPLVDVVSLPSMPFKSAEKGSEVLWRLYEKFPSIQKEFSDVTVIALFTSEPYMLITTQKPVRTLEDLKGLKLRTTGGPPTEQLKTLGASPMLISMPDCYLAMVNGVIDGMAASWESMQAFRLYEAANYYTEAPLPATYFSVVMNRQKWNRLPKEVQGAITGTGGLEGSRFWGKNHFDTAKQAVINAAKAKGRTISVYTLPDDERERWLRVGGKPLWDAWVKEMRSRGHREAQSLLDYALQISE